MQIDRQFGGQEFWSDVYGALASLTGLRVEGRAWGAVGAARFDELTTTVRRGSPRQLDGGVVTPPNADA
jgi:hypothetical protein